MSAANTFLGTMEGGKFKADDPAALTRAFATRKDGTRMVLTVKKHVPKRSDDMNAYWWACVVEPFREEMGLDNKEDAHNAILIEIGHWEWKDIFGRREKRAKPTRDLPENEFMQLIDKAQRLFSEYFGGRVPPKDSKQAAAMMAGS